jgi:recombination protein RecA
MGSDIDTLVKEVKGALKNELAVLKDVEIWVPTGVPWLDLAFGGGLPLGRMITLIGRKSVGKSTLAIHLLARIQKMGGLAVGLDVERSNLKSRCEAQGLDMDRYLASQPESLDSFVREDIVTGKKVKVKGAFDIMEDVIRAVRSKSPDTLVGITLDSVAGSSVASELEGDVGDATMGKHARILSQAFRKIMPVVHDMNIGFILVNQLKEKIGVMFGSPNTYIGKNPIDFHSAITVEMTSGGPWPPAGEPEGIITRVFVSKNKVGNPFMKVQLVTWFDRGIDTVWETISFLEDKGVFGTAKGWLEFDGKKYRKSEFYSLAARSETMQESLTIIAKEMVDAALADRKTKVDGADIEIPEAATA